MASADFARSSTSELEEFVALNDEIAALVRAGLPLEIGLGREHSRISGRIAGLLREGHSLEEALEREGKSLPPVYRAMVAAGLRSGRLADAVETISRTAKTLILLRRRLALASIYPAILIVLTFGLSVVVLPRLLTMMAVITGERDETPPVVVTTAIYLLRDNPTGWLFWLPGLLLLVLWASGSLTAIVRHLPGLQGVLRSFRIAAFAELAAGLLHHGTPLDEALVLAADASGDRSLALDAAQAASRLRAGQTAAEAIGSLQSLPRFPRWMLSAGAAQGTLAATMRHVADWAARRGATRTDWYLLTVPALLTVLVGGLSVAGFAAASIGPLIALLYQLASEISL